MKSKSRYNFFWLIAALLFGINLLVMNDVTTFWPGAETKAIQNLLLTPDSPSETPSLIPYEFFKSVYRTNGLHEFRLRLLGSLGLFFTFLGFFFLGKKIFGKEAVLMTMLIVAGSFLIPFVAKMVVSDIWLMGAQLLQLITLILFIKQPRPKWAYWSGGFFMMGMMVSPISMLIWMIVLSFYFLAVHPKGKNLLNSYFYGSMLIVVLISIWLKFWQWGDIAAVFSFEDLSIGKYGMWLLLGMLPWLGFLPAALWDMFQKLKTKEELALINLGWLIAGLFSFSLVVEFLLAFLIAKQVLLYFQTNYPYKRIVKFFTLLNMLMTFLAVFAVLMGGAFQFNASGYRLFLGIGAAYWISTFIGVIGLFSVRKNIVIGGITTGAILSFYLFWMQINPFLETSRSTPKRWPEQSTELVEPRKVSALQVCVPSFEKEIPLKIYAKARGIQSVSTIVDPSSLRGQFQQDKTSVFVLDEKSFQLIRPSITSFTKVDSASTRLQMFSDVEMIYFVSGH